MREWVMGVGGRSTSVVLPPPKVSQYSRRPSSDVAKPCSSGCRARAPVSVIVTSRPRLEDEVERRLGHPPEAREAGALRHLADPRLARLRTERQPDLLRQ